MLTRNCQNKRSSLSPVREISWLKERTPVETAMRWSAPEVESELAPRARGGATRTLQGFPPALNV